MLFDKIGHHFGHHDLRRLQRYGFAGPVIHGAPAQAFGM